MMRRFGVFFFQPSSDCGVMSRAPSPSPSPAFIAQAISASYIVSHSEYTFYATIKTLNKTDDSEPHMINFTSKT